MNRAKAWPGRVPEDLRQRWRNGMRWARRCVSGHASVDLEDGEILPGYVPADKVRGRSISAVRAPRRLRPVSGTLD